MRVFHLDDTLLLKEFFNILFNLNLELFLRVFDLFEALKLSIIEELLLEDNLNEPIF